jgi:transposase
MGGSFVKAHQHCHGAAGDEDQAIGQSRGGNNTKIHMVVESGGLPLDFKLTGGEVHDVKVAPQLLLNVSVADYMIADRGYDSEEIRTLIRENGSTPMIPRKRNLIVGNADMDWCLYKYRHLVENVFARLKHFRAIATRYDKLKRNYASMLAMACSYLWLPM